jgi:predicted O-linked N-acetylglucosamine transferase (SPINDLY family)
VGILGGMMPAEIQDLFERGRAEHRAGRRGDAEALYRAVLAERPDHDGALHLLGVLACDFGHFDAAVALMNRAITLNPGAAEYHGNLGEVHRRAGRRAEAGACFARALELEPGRAETLSNLAIVLKDEGRLDEAIDACERAIALRPDLAEAHCNLGLALHAAGRNGEAIAAYRRAIAVRGDLVAAHNNLGIVLKDEGRLDEAIDVTRTALALDPALAPGFNNLGNALRDAGRLAEALDCYRRAVALRPDYAEAGSNYLFTLHSHPAFDGQVLLAEHRAWARQFAATWAGRPRRHGNDASPGRRLCVGFVSPDLRGHAVGYLLLPLFEHVDRAGIEITAYADVRRPDPTTYRLQALAARWRSIVGLADEQVADLVQADEIDILVDLSLHTAGNRMLVFARKPAPVQVTMLGLPATTGLDAIDYRLTDPYLDPPEARDEPYAERSIRLPHCFWCYSPPEEAPAVGPLPALGCGHVTFGCLNHFSKASVPAQRLWARVLAAVPGSRLVLQAPEGSPRDAVAALFGEEGVARDRLDFVAAAPRAEYSGASPRSTSALTRFPTGDTPARSTRSGWAYPSSRWPAAPPWGGAPSASSQTSASNSSSPPPPNATSRSPWIWPAT